MNKQYYDGVKLLSMKDIRGKTPEIYLCTTNRTGGKTTYFGRLVVNRFLKTGAKFGLIFRYAYELDDVADKFFQDIGGLFFPGNSMTSKKKAGGAFHELYLDEESCGYAFALNSADQVKKYSHYFTDIESMIMDEFQNEYNKYCKDEIKKFISIHTSVARGQGKQVRYVPVYMLANTVSVLNPYYYELGISNRLRADTKFLRGNGFVLEQGFIDSASRAQQESAFNMAFAQNEYVAYSSEAVYLNDNTAFIEKPAGKPKYICTFKYKSQNFGVKEFSESGFLYCDDKPDLTFPNRVVLTTEDHQPNYVMLQRHDFMLSSMRFLFEKGGFRFKNLACKEAVLTALKY